MTVEAEEIQRIVDLRKNINSLSTKAIGKMGRNIKRLRQEREMSLDGLGALIGYSASYLSTIENGARPGTIKMMISIAAVLETTPNDLLEF